MALLLVLAAFGYGQVVLESEFKAGIFMPAMVHAGSSLTTVYTAVNDTDDMVVLPSPGFLAKVVLQVCADDMSGCSVSHTLASTENNPSAVTYDFPLAAPNVGLALSSDNVPMGAFTFGGFLFTFACDNAGCSTVSTTNHTVAGFSSQKWAHVEVVLGTDNVMTVFFGTGRDRLNICRCSTLACTSVSCLITTDDFFSMDVRMSSSAANAVPVLTWFTADPTRCASVSSTNVPDLFKISVCADMACSSFTSEKTLDSNILPCTMAGVHTLASPTLSINATGAVTILAESYTINPSNRYDVGSRFYSCPDTQCGSVTQVDPPIYMFTSPMSIAPPGTFFKINRVLGQIGSTSGILQCTNTSCASFSTTDVGDPLLQGRVADAALTDTHTFLVASYNPPLGDPVGVATTLGIFRGNPPGGGGGGGGGVPSVGAALYPCVVSVVVAIFVAGVAMMYTHE